jgi:hypothetical protein
LGRSFKDSFGHAAAGGDLWTTWEFYEMVDDFSTLTGLGDFAGNILYAQHMPDNYYYGFQCGQAANDRNPNFGMSGWFTVTGVFNNEFITGHGDINVDKECEAIPLDDCPNDTAVTYYYRAQDSCGNNTIASYTVTVLDEIAPEFTVAPADITIECSDELPLAEEAVVEATDNCECGVVSLEYLGEFAIEGGNSCEYQLERIWKAVDCCENEAFHVQIITVVDTTAPEVSFVPGDLTIECDQDVPLVLAEGIDACDNGVEVDNVDVIIEGDCPQEYTIERTFILTDICGNSVEAGPQIISVVDTTAPVFGDYQVAVAVECTDVESVQGPEATDNCGDVTITFEDVLQSGGCLGVIARTYTAVDECGNTATTQQFITLLDTTPPTILNPEDATVECDAVPATPGADGIDIFDNCGLEVTVAFTEEIIDGDCADNYTIVWTWTATDFCENVSTATTTITVQDTTNPVFEVVPENLTLECDEEVPACDVESVVASDNCDADVFIECSSIELPGNCLQNYTIQRIYRAYDNCGNQAIYVQLITVQDTTAPVFGDQENEFTYECNTDIPVVTPIVTDNCGEVSLSFVDGEQVQGDCPQAFGFIRTWTATDECGNSATFTQAIEVVDTTAPLASGEAEIEAPCDDFNNLYISATDNCALEVDITWQDVLVSGGCAGTVIRTYTLTDECGNSSTFQQIIGLTDEVPPVIAEGPADMTFECSDELPVLNEDDVIAFDNCTEEVVISVEETQVDGDCVGSYQLIRVWTATDNCANFSTYTQTITVQDTTAPVFTAVADDVTIECDEVIPAPFAEATDNCSEVTISVVEVETPGACPQNYTITRTYTATDDCGNAATATQVVTVQDTTAPEFGFIGMDVTVECDEEIPAPAFEVTDNCGIVSVEIEEDITEGDCPQEYTIVRCYIATDECGNEAILCQTITVVDTTAPEIQGSITVDVPCDALDQAYITATDNCGEVEIVWVDMMLSGGCANNIIRNYTVTDECGNTSTFEQIISLIDEEAPVFEETPMDATYECDAEVPAGSVEDVVVTDNCTEVEVEYSEVEVEGDCAQNYTIIRTWTATDDCDNVAEHVQTITVQDTTAPEFEFVPADATYECDEIVPACGDESAMAFDNCGEVIIECNEVTIDGDCPQAFTIERTFTATDECGNVATALQIITVQDTTAPVFGEQQTEFTYECDEEIPVIFPIVTDNCGEVELFAQDGVIGPPFVNGQQVEGDCPQEYSIIIVWTAIDACGNESEFTQIINVVDTTAPEILGEAQVDAPCDNFEGIFISATDNCGEVTIDYSDTMVSGGCAGSILRVYTVADECGNTAEFQQIINLVDEVAPVFTTVPVDMTYECLDEIPACDIFSVAAIDNCSEPSIECSEAIIDGDCPQNYTIVRTYTATDNCENVATHVQTITVQDTTAPVFEFVADDVTIECDQVIPAPSSMAFDNCGEVTVDVSQVIIDGDCVNNYTIERTYVATDACGNTSEPVVQIITVQDTTAPELFSVAGDLILECTDDIPAGSAMAMDNCGDAEVIITETEVIGDCPQERVITRTYVAVDACGNQSDEVTQTITVVDTTAPELVGSPDVELVLDCEDVVPMPIDPPFVDNCDDDFEILFNEEIIGDLPAEGSSADCLAVTPEAFEDGETCTNHEPWSVVLFSLTPGNDSRYSTITANWVEFPNGDATLTGLVVSNDNPNAGWEISANFTGGFSWEEWSTQAFPTSFKDDCNLDNGEHLDWTYYLMTAGATLTGWGEYEGSVLTLLHAPANFFYGYQVGMGANNVNANYGGGGWFTYSGIYNGEEVSGAGDFAFDHDCCPRYQIERTWCAIDCAGNETCFTQTIRFEDLGNDINGPGVDGFENAGAIRGDFAIVNLYPNPVSDAADARMSVHVKNASVVRIEVVDVNGRILEVPFEGALLDGQELNAIVPTARLESGMYTVRVVSDDHSDFRKLMILK